MRLSQERPDPRFADSLPRAQQATSRGVQCLEEIMFEWYIHFQQFVRKRFHWISLWCLAMRPWGESRAMKKKTTINLLFGNFIFPFYSGNCLAELKHYLLFFVFHKFEMRQEKLASSMTWGHAIMAEKYTVFCSFGNWQTHLREVSFQAGSLVYSHTCCSVVATLQPLPPGAKSSRVKSQLWILAPWLKSNAFTSFSGVLMYHLSNQGKNYPFSTCLPGLLWH